LLIVFLSAGYCTYMGQQARADVVIVHLPKRAREVVETITWFLCAVIFGLISWYVAKLGWIETINPLNRATMLLRIPYGPFILVSALGCVFVCISSLVNCYRSLLKAQSRKDVES
jgi:TRAP-type C4-dicarboxylate transport system permease small subunit